MVRSGVAGEPAAVLLHGAPGDLTDLLRLGLVKRGVADQSVQLRRPEPGDVMRRSRRGEQPAGDELLEESAVAFLGEGEHRRPGQRPHRAPDAGEGLTHVERALATRHVAAGRAQCIDPLARRSTPG